MADFYTPVRIPRPAFDQLIARVDKGIGEHAVALVLSEDFPFRELNPVDSTHIDFSDLKIEKPLDVINYLDQLLYFAFENLPREIITSWAKSYEAEQADEALERVEYIRDNMPNLSDLWGAKNDAIVPPLTGFAYESTGSHGNDLRRANLYLSAARIEPGGAPDKTDLVRFRVQLWPSDVRFLIRELQHLWDAHLAAPQTKERGEHGDVTTDETRS